MILKVVKNWIILNIFMLVITFLIVNNAYEVRKETVIESIKMRESTVVENLESEIYTFFRYLESDIRYLANTPHIRNNSIDDHAIDTFVNFLLAKPQYDQLRVLDTNGFETLRLNNIDNNNVEVVSKDNLQDKSERYYFKETIVLDKGSIYISPMDLNMENGVIEIPEQPTIRVASPIFDDSGKKTGIAILNYKSNEILESLKGRLDSLYGHLDLVNQDGYWFISEDSSRNWGFMYNNNKTFFNLESQELWDLILKDNSNNFMFNNSFYTFRTVYPVQLINNEPNESTKLKWKIISSITEEQFDSILLGISANYLNSGILISIFILISTFIILYTLSRKHNSDRLRIETEKRYHILFDEANEGIIIANRQGIINANNNASKIFNYSSNEFQNLKVEDLFSENDKTKVNKIKDACINNEIYNKSVEFQGNTKNKTKKWLEAHLSIFTYNNEKNLILFITDISRRKKKQQQLKMQAITDPLTSCFNRRYFYNQLLIKTSMQNNSKTSVVMFDIDHFKNINDTYGHPTGDLVIKELVKLIQKNIREVDILGRLGGEEFAVILASCSLENGVKIAENIRKSVESLVIVDKEKHINFTVSGGVTELDVFDNEDSVMSRVDKLLYKSKSYGRNRISY